MTNIKGNKGEWSEMYVLLRLLAQGRIYTADENVQKIEDMYFPILKVIREEIKARPQEYVINAEDSKVQIYINQELVDEFPSSTFEQQADYLYQQILVGGNRAFSVEQIEEFMTKIKCARLAAPSTDKTDITMQIHDIQTGYNPICGFSIKSDVGSPPTLINASGATNFIYEVTGLSDMQIEEINQIETREKIKDRMSRIFNESTAVTFVKVNSDTFSRNLMLVDSLLADLMAHSLIYYYRDNTARFSDIIEVMERENPLNYPNQGFYEFKLKKFLCATALGMKPSTNWDGQDEANGGYIIVTSGGDVLAYHIYNRCFFESYLLNHTRFERASTSRHGFASLYKEDGKVLLKLNLQVRFC